MTAAQRREAVWEARRKAYSALVAAGVRTTEIAAAFDLDPDTVKFALRRLGLQRPPNPKLSRDPIDGEIWRGIAGYDAEISNLGRVYSVNAKTLLKPRKLRGAVRDSVRVRLLSGGVKDVRVDALMSIAFGTISGVHVRSWTQDEDTALRRARSRDEAIQAIPTRSWRAIEGRASKLGVKLTARDARPAGPVKGSVPHANPLWSAAHAVVPRGLSEDVRDDLISAMVLMTLEGHATDMRSALKLAVAERNRIMGVYKERSYDAPIPGTDGLRLIDTFASDVEHV